MSVDQALNPIGDWERLKAELPQTEIDYNAANAEHTKQIRTATAVRIAKSCDAPPLRKQERTRLTMTLTLALPPAVEESLTREAVRQGVPLDIYALRVLEQHVLPQSRSDRAAAALQAWRDDASRRDQQEPENDLLQAIDQDRLSDRPLFPPELKGVSW